MKWPQCRLYVLRSITVLVREIRNLERNVQAEADEALGAISQSMTGATDQKQSMEELKAATEKVFHNFYAFF